MYDNKLEGGIPEGLWSLAALQSLYLAMNQFTSTLSATVAKPTKLTYLLVALCHLEIWTGRLTACLLMVACALIKACVLWWQVLGQ